MSKVLEVSIAFRIFPVLCRLIARKTQSHPPAYTRESRDSLLFRTFHPCHSAAPLPPSEDSHTPLPERRNSPLRHDREGGGHRTGWLVRIGWGAAAGRPAGLVGSQKSGGLPLAINTGTCVRINQGFPRSAPHGTPKSRVNRSVEADLTRDPRSPGILGQKTRDIPAIFLVGLLDAARKRAAEEEAMSAQRRARKATRIEKKAAKLQSDQAAVGARLHMTCRICDVSRHPGGEGCPLASVSKVQGYFGGRLCYCGAHRELLCWLRRGFQVDGGS